MINTNSDIHISIVSKLSQIIVEIWYEKQALCVFEPSCGGICVTYNVHLRLIEKLVVDFLVVSIELFFARCYG